MVKALVTGGDAGDRAALVARLAGPANAFATCAKGDLDAVAADAEIVLLIVDAAFAETLTAIQRAAPQAPAIAVVETLEDETAAALLRAGAVDVVPASHAAQLRASIDLRCVESLGHLRRMQAERDLRRSQAWAHDVLDEMVEGVALVGSEGRFLLVNRAARVLLGWRAANLPLATDDLALVDRRRIYVPPGRQPVARALSTGTPQEAVLGRAEDDGTFRWLSWVATPFREPAEDIGRALLVTISDVTEAVQAAENAENLENQLFHAHKLKTLGLLSGGIAHDFNNILAPICGYVELALRRVEPGSDVAGDLEHIHAGATRARELVRRIAAFGGKSDAHPRHVRVEEIVGEVLDLLRVTLPETVEVRQRTAPGCGTAFADPGQLHQIVMNLCTNAVRAMPDGGVLTVRVDALDVAAGDLRPHEELEPGPAIRLRVEDTGLGMTEEVLEHLFEPFFTTGQRRQGTGLGLAIVHGIVRRHAGAIRVRSVVGRGTRFDVLLPTRGVAAPTPETPTDLSGTERILVVDDEPGIAVMLERMLEPFGYDVEPLEHPARALAMLRRDPARFDALVTDFDMPRMSGVVLADEAHLLRPDLPVLMVTGVEADVSPEARQRAGIREVLPKPVSAEEVAAALRRGFADRGAP